MQTDFIIDAMREAGCEPANHADVVLDDKPHYYQVAGDKRSVKRASYCMNEQGGWFYDHRAGKSYSVRRGEKSELTAAEMQAIREVRENQRKERAAFDARRRKKMDVWLKRLFNKAPKASSHAYLTAKGIQAHNARIRVKTGELYIPIYASSGLMLGLQRISLKFKGYSKGTQKAGGYAAFAKAGDDLSTIVICEGWATGATIKEATGLAVFAAMDAGNVRHVAAALRKKYPDARIVFAADSDQWTFNPKKRPADLNRAELSGDDNRWIEWRDNGFCQNVGVEAAQQAAVAIGGGHVIIPPFNGTEPDKPTDWNDYAASFGHDEIKRLFNEALEIRRETSDEASHGEALSPAVPHPVAGDILEPERKSQTGDFGMNYRVLGYNDGIYYYFPFVARQIVALAASQHSMQNLLQIDALVNWENKFGYEKASHSKIALFSSAALISLAQQRGVYKESDRVRGCGTWIDNGDVVLHCGDTLYVNGAQVAFKDYLSHYTYIAAPRLMRPADNPLTNEEAHRLLEICEKISWENKLSGSLLAGWLVVAPICAALQYRPHIYITGEAESGKSTVMDRIIKPVLGSVSLNVDGGTTEPAIRSAMGYDARPLVFDEAEPSPSMSAVIGLARKASTGAVVEKFGQKPFKARFSACFSAINPPVDKTADESRISFMVIKKNRAPDAIQQYDNLMSKIEDIITDDFSERLLARTLENMNSLLANIRTFQRSSRKVMKAARASQQIGTMLAGLYLLHSTKKISEADAEKWIARHDWTDHTIIAQDGDPLRLVQTIAESLLRYGASGADTSIGELINMVYREHDMAADKLLRNYGIAVRDSEVLIASRSQNLAKVLRGTDWEIKWSRTLSDVPDARKEKCVYFAKGVKTSAVALPILLFKGDE
jgi:putative DNA primase/helicase